MEILGDLRSEVVGVLRVTVAQASNGIGKTVAIVLQHARDGEVQAEEVSEVVGLDGLLI